MHPILVFRSLIEAGTAPGPSPVAPSIIIIGSPVSVAGNVGTALTLDLSQYVVVSDGGTPTYTPGALPAGLTISGGVLSGTPEEPSSATCAVVVSYSNAAGTATPQTLTLEFSIAAASTPVLSINPSTYTVSGTQNTAITSLDIAENVVVTNPTAGASLSFSSADLPSGLSISSAGVISGTPTASGTVASTVTIAYPGATSITATVTFTIAAAGQTYYYTVTGTFDVDGDYWLYSGTHGTNSAIYTNGTYYLLHNPYNNTWGIKDTTVTEDAGPFFWAMYFSMDNGATNPLCDTTPPVTYQAADAYTPAPASSEAYLSAYVA